MLTTDTRDWLRRQGDRGDEIEEYIAELEAQLAEAQKMADLHKAFHDLVVKERDLARYQLAKLTAAAIRGEQEE